MKRPHMSIVVPVYNETNSLRDLYRQIQAVMQEPDFSSAYTWEILFVDDGSTDSSISTLKDLARKYSNVQLVLLARNFGKEIALSAGLQECRGDAAILMDSDLQHPPRYIRHMIDTWANGADMVVGVRKSSGERNVFKRFSSGLFNWFIMGISISAKLFGLAIQELIMSPVLYVAMYLLNRSLNKNKAA